MLNNNIQEAYCSFEVSKLLKEKGFDVSGYLNTVWLGNNYEWRGKGKNKRSVEVHIFGYGEGTKLPTHGLAIEWIMVNFGKDKISHLSYDMTKEEIEAALKHILTNLIK